MSIQEQISRFFESSAYGVVGASASRYKYGNKVLRCYLQNARKVYGISRRESEVEGAPCVPDVASLPEPVHGDPRSPFTRSKSRSEGSIGNLAAARRQPEAVLENVMAPCAGRVEREDDGFG